MKAPHFQHLHLVDATKSIKVGDYANLQVNAAVRKALSRNHSVEHLIQHALQTVISSTIKQEGAYKSAEKVTFDFQYPHKLTDEQIEKVEKYINELINKAAPVTTHHMTLEEAKQFGAIA
jgi:alanyl-tRNA synthetase